jgi:hypothetical protein
MRNSRVLIISALIAGLLFVALSCSKDGVGPMDPPHRPTITNPYDGSSLNSPSINVIGRSDSYSTVEIYLDGEPTGATAVSTGGRFTVEGVELGGDQSMKHLQARAVDLYGKTSSLSDTVSVFLDLVRPPYHLEYISGADIPDPPPGETPDSLDWETLLGDVDIVGRTELGATVRIWEAWGSTLPELTYPDMTEEYDVDGDEIADSLRFTSTVQLLQGQNTFLVEVLDAAENVTSDTIVVSYVAETECKWIRYDTDFEDNGDAFNGEVNALAEMEVAVRFAVPDDIEGRYLSEVAIYMKNDQTGPPNTPTTQDFELRLYDVNEEGRPTSLPFFSQRIQGGYEEEAWLSLELNTETGPSVDLQGRENFAIAVHYLHRYNPWIGVDLDPIEIDGRSYRYNWSSWEHITYGDYGIRARVCTTRGEEGKGLWLTPK